MDNYRSPTPTTLSGATVVDAIKTRQLLDQGNVAFIDVLPSPRRPEKMDENDIWLPKKRMNIPGSIWLADIGFGVISEELEIYFKSNMEQLLEQGYQQFLFYCNSDCWMSWNAAKRALDYGFSHIFWFPGGVDEWAEQGFDLSLAEVVKIDE